MQSIRIAAVSINGGLGAPQQSLERIAEWSASAAQQGADLVLFPELVVHGHCTPNTFELAEPVPDGPSTRRLAQIACELGIIISAGLSEKEHDLVYNTQVHVGPDGFIGSQRKIHLSRDEVLFYKGGTQMDVFDVGKCRVGTVICYDNALPEVARILALRGADVILAPHAARIKMWDDTEQSAAAARRASHDTFMEYRLRARENACFYVIADQAGRAGYVDTYPRESPNQPHHAGAAIILGPDGSTLAASQTQKIQDEMVLATLDPADLAVARSVANYTLRTRRPELFGPLVRQD
jgi:N-carbamoylputrescine amidase